MFDPVGWIWMQNPRIRRADRTHIQGMLFSPGLNVVAIGVTESRGGGRLATGHPLMPLPSVLLKVAPEHRAEDPPESSGVSE